MIPLFPITSAGVEEIVQPWILLDTITTDSSLSFVTVYLESSNGLPANGTGQLIFNIIDFYNILNKFDLKSSYLSQLNYEI